MAAMIPAAGLPRQGFLIGASGRARQPIELADDPRCLAKSFFWMFLNCVDKKGNRHAYASSTDCKGYHPMISFGMTSSSVPQGQPVQDAGLDYLLGLDGDIQVQNDEGYWVKFEVTRVEATLV